MKSERALELFKDAVKQDAVFDDAIDVRMDYLINTDELAFAFGVGMVYQVVKFPLREIRNTTEDSFMSVIGTPTLDLLKVEAMTP